MYPHVFTISALVFLTEMVLDIFNNTKSLLSNSFFWMLFWFSTAITFISLDQQTTLIGNIIKEKPDNIFSITFIKYLSEQKESPYIKAGLFPGLGRLSAAGQAAMYTRLATMTTGVTITVLNLGIMFIETRIQILTKQQKPIKHGLLEQPNKQLKLLRPKKLANMKEINGSMKKK